MNFQSRKIADDELYDLNNRRYSSYNVRIIDNESESSSDNNESDIYHIYDKEIDEIDMDIMSTVHNPSAFHENVPKLPGRHFKLDIYRNIEIKQNDDLYFDNTIIADTTLSQLVTQIQSDLDRLKVGFNIEPSDNEEYKEVSNQDNHISGTGDINSAYESFLFDNNEDNQKKNYAKGHAFEFLTNDYEQIDAQNLLFIKSIADKEINIANELFQKLRILRCEIEEKTSELSKLKTSIDLVDIEDKYVKLSSDDNEYPVTANSNEYSCSNISSNQSDVSNVQLKLINPDSISTISKKVISSLHVAMDTLLSNFPDGENGLVKAVLVDAVKTTPTMSIVPPNLVKPNTVEIPKAPTQDIKPSDSAVFYQVTSAALEKQLKAIDQKMNDISVGNITSTTSSSALNYSRYSSKIPLALEKSTSVPFKVVRSQYSGRTDANEKHTYYPTAPIFMPSSKSASNSSTPLYVNGQNSFASEFSLVKQKEKDLANLQSLKSSIKLSIC